jgi:hypothetical protein
MSDQQATSALLASALDPERFGDGRYLEWFYDENPRGAAIDENVDEDGRRVAHYGVLPTIWRTPAGPTPFIFSSNVATDPSVRRGGLFREMAERVYKRAAATGAPGMIAVTNDQSTVVVVDRFGWGLLGPMPVRVCVPYGRTRGIEHYGCTPAFLASRQFADLTADLDWVPVRAWTQSWTTDYLQWRLRRPDTDYVLHASPDALAVSRRYHGPAGVPFAVLLKVFPRPGATLPVPTAPLVAAACRAQRAPLCVYAGWNAGAHVRGIRTPPRLQPSPLNIVYKSFDEERAPQATFRPDTFEFLDEDAF